ncbi:MAG: hypothetical protein KTR28_08705 [Micavibrio sp.]|nr:hypothetical protein [Micavibrio sp.]
MSKILPLVLLSASVLLSGCAYDVHAENHGASPSVDGDAVYVERSGLNIALETNDLLDQNAMVLGIPCSGIDYKMQTVSDLKASMEAIDVDAALGNTKKPDVSVVADVANATLRCVAETSLSAKCQGSVNLSGKTVSKRGKVTTFSISKKRVTETYGSCGAGSDVLEGASYDAVSELVELVKAYDK